MNLLIGIFLMSFPAWSSAVTPPLYQSKGLISIGGEGGWDYLLVDPMAHRLYLSQATRVVVVDLQTQKVLGEISSTPGVHGIALAPELGRGFTSNGKEDQVTIFDLLNLKTISKIKTGRNPDAIVYDSGTAHIYAFNGKSKSATVIDAKSGTVISTIPLSGKPEFAAVDPVAHQVYVNIEDQSVVTAIDTRTQKVVATWPIAPGETATGMSIDLLRHRLYLGCENQKMVMMDSVSGKVLDTAPIGKGVDATAFDPVLGYALSSNGEGTVTVVLASNAGKLSVVQVLKTQKGSRTLALDTGTHFIYLPAAEFQTLTGEAVEGHHPRVVPGSLKLLVYGPSLQEKK